jgi:molybdenum cofactor cytidylyltransferase
VIVNNYLIKDLNESSEAKKLADALKVSAGDVIAFVGAGGKTGLMLALADELHHQGVNVAVTTTTKLGVEERPKNSELILASESEELVSKLQSREHKDTIPVLAMGLNQSRDRLLGLSPDLVDQLTGKFDALLIEADGARRRSFKVPRDHEPVVPEGVNKLCIVIGLDAIDKPVDEEFHYNLPGMETLGASRGDVLTLKLIAKLLHHPNGYLRFQSPTRQFFLVLNKYDLLPKKTELDNIADHLFHNAIDKIMVTSTLSPKPVKLIPSNREQKVYGIVLAAGAGTRFGGIKQLADLGGKSLLGHVLDRSLASKLHRVVLVLGYEVKIIKSELSDFLKNPKLIVVENEEYSKGMSTSLQTGLQAIKEKAGACMFILGDQPNISTELINNLLDSYLDSKARLCVPMIPVSGGTNSRPGNPVIINQKLYSDIFKLSGDIGAREVVRNNLTHAKLVHLGNTTTQVQINTQEDMVQYQKGEK